MADPKIKIKRSAVAGKIPTTTSLELGELAINTYDGKVFIQQDRSAVGIGSTIITINPWSVGTGTNTYNTYFTAGNVGIGTTNPTDSGLSVLGKISILQNSTSDNRIILRGQPGSSYRWSIDNYGPSNEFRIFKEDDATAANGAVRLSITDTGTVTANAFVGDGSGLTNLPTGGGGGGGVNYWSLTSVGINTLSNVGIGTTNPTSKLTVTGDSLVVGVSTANSFRARGGAPGGLGVNNNGYGFHGIGDNDSGMYSSADGQVEFYSNSVEVTRITSNQNILIGGITETGTSSQKLQVTGGSYLSGNLGLGNTNPTSKLSVQGDGNFTGVVTATTFVGSLTGTATTASSVTLNSVGLGTHTYGDYVKDITGTSNQVTVTSGTGEGSSPVISLPNALTAPQDLTVTRDLQVNRNLNVNGNITIGGSSATLFTTELKIYDPDIVLGFRTDALGNDSSTDSTANHSGVAVASTEGNPLTQLFIAGIETNPATYKKFMWFKEGTFSGLGTDAWLSNYAIGIGSTQFPSGTRFATGSIQFDENDIRVVRSINSSGVVTAIGGFNLGISSNGTLITSGPVTRLNFVGTGNTFTTNGTTVDISISSPTTSTSGPSLGLVVASTYNMLMP